jgi:hypothetical protein
MGKGIYGHFELIACDDSGKVNQRTATDDRAWRKDKGANVKSISISLDAAPDLSKVEISFQETRVESQTEASGLEEKN